MSDPRECPKRCPERLSREQFALGQWCEFLAGHKGLHRGAVPNYDGTVDPDAPVLWWGTAEEYDEEALPAGCVTVLGEPATPELIEAIRKAFRTRGGAL